MKLRLATAVAALVTAFAAVTGTLVGSTAATAATAASAASAASAADPTGPPPLADGFGLTQVSDPSLVNNPGIPGNTATDFRITVTTAQVANAPGTVGHHIRIVLPSDYNSDPGKRYPVLYLLNGSPGDPCDYFDADRVPGFDGIKNNSGMIIVMPDGGARGWYTNWLMQNTEAGAQNWENFEIDQVIPFIDANLRTLADRAHRGIAGISMGGFGALHLAQLHPDLFSQVATLSGEDDISANEMIFREVMIASMTNQKTQVFAPLVSLLTGGVQKWSYCQPVDDPYQPSVSNTDAMYGTPYPFSLVTPPYNDSLWNAADPTEHASAFAGMNVSIYVGNGRSVPTTAEFWLESESQHFAAALANAGQHPYFVDYGGGAGWGSCDGQHDYSCWDHDLVDLLPRMQAAFAGSPATPATAVGQATVATQGLCLDVRNGAFLDNTPVQVYGCNGSVAQSWTVGFGSTVRSMGKCLDVSGGGTTNGTGVDLYACNGTGAQNWVPQADGTLLNPQSGRCLTDPAVGGAGTQAVIQDCAGGTDPDQQWTLPRATA
ncbi:S-formylglutathione hydrolase FrmB [Streptacidiphilus sp. MAP12-33]|uniref:alpha/beta hydrolase-fold protein n=1 Tax=Streptacidiphilus sp. MAP12-33 TaxID=3156266 RepID=UPI0035146BD6